VPFVPVNKTLEKVLRNCHLGSDLDVYQVFSLWNSLVGEGTARHAQPARVRGQILYVEVDDPLWLSQLRYMKGDILAKIEKEVKKGVLKDLRFFLKGASQGETR
jgi:predicted nucleic acid-binding Zn ribbon protein